MNEKDLMLYDLYEFIHERKGTFKGRLIFNDEKTIIVRLSTEVRGIVKDWKPGDEMVCRKILISSYKSIDE